MTGSGKISFRQGAKGYRHIGTYAKLLQRGMKRILPKMSIYVQLICSRQVYVTWFEGARNDRVPRTGQGRFQISLGPDVKHAETKQ
jgi:hypothetical protein